MSPEPTTPTREEVEAAAAAAALDECAALTDGDIKVMARWIKQRLTSEPAGPDKYGQTPADYEDLGRSFLEEYYSVQDDPAMKDYICADSPVEIISHLLNAVAEAKADLALLAASTGARGAVVEEIAKRHEAREAGHKLYAESGCAVQAVSPQVHDDCATLLALIGAKTP